METLYFPKNDKGYILTFTITNSAGTVRNLTDYTVTLKVWAADIPGTLVVSGACSKTDPTNGVCTYTPTATDFDAAATYDAEIELTATGIVESTERFQIIVEESG